MKRHAPEGTVVIRKYPNRRLYDVTRSKHLTLDELVELIKQGREVQVIDSKTREDITPAVLAQVVLEQNSYLFSADFLHQLIRNQDGLIGDFLTEFLPKVLDSYLETRDLMRRQMTQFTTPQAWLGQSGALPFTNPLTNFTDHLRQFRPPGFAPPPDSTRGEEPETQPSSSEPPTPSTDGFGTHPDPSPIPNPPPEQSEVDDLKQRLLDLETRMASLKD